MTTAQFEAVAARDALVARIRAFSEKAGFTRVVIGISGGKDSSVAAALCARALGKENVFGVLLPDGEQADIEDSKSVVSALGINVRVVNIQGMHAALMAAVGADDTEDHFSVPYDRESEINACPRMRMTCLRYIAQALGAFLCGTGNLSEATVGYCTKDGDTSSDFNPLGALTSLEVVAIGHTLPELPAALVDKTPSDGLSGVSDEEKMGLRYADIHAWIRRGTCGDPAIDRKIAERARKNAHKRERPPILSPFED